MKTKKIVIAVLMATLLISVGLIVGCMSQFEGISDKDTEENYQIPEGKGIVRIKFVDSKAKTILPVASLSTYTYDLLITRNSGAEVGTNQTGLSKTALDSGAYHVITLDAHNDWSFSLTAKDGTKSVGSYTATINVPSGGNTNVEAALTPYLTGQGTFTYTIDKAANGNTTFDIFNSSGTSIGTNYFGHTSQSGTDTASFPISVGATTLSETITLTAGYYVVKVTATDTNYQTIQYIHALHIYGNMDSELTQDLSLITLARDRFIVTYKLPETDTSGLYADDDTDIVYYNHKIVVRDTNNDGTGTIGPTFATNTFSGWYTEIGYSTQWIPATNRVTGNVTLYAKASPPGTGSATITVSFPINDMDDVEEGGVPIVNDTISITRASYLGGTEIVLTAPLTGTIIWSIGGVDINFGLSNDGGITGDTLTINNSDQFIHLFPGGFAVVNVRNALLNPTYSKSITIELTP